MGIRLLNGGLFISLVLWLSSLLLWLSILDCCGVPLKSWLVILKLP